MTEDRPTRIENALQSLSESQAKHESAIHDLIVVSRTVLESQQETTVQIRELHEIDRKLGHRLDALAQQSAHTDEKLHALIEIVDRIIRKKNGENGFS